MNKRSSVKNYRLNKIINESIKRVIRESYRQDFENVLPQLYNNLGCAIDSLKGGFDRENISPNMRQLLTEILQNSQNLYKSLSKYKKTQSVKQYRS